MASGGRNNVVQANVHPLGHKEDSRLMHICGKQRDDIGLRHGSKISQTIGRPVLGLLYSEEFLLLRIVGDCDWSPLIFVIDCTVVRPRALADSV